MLSHMVTSTPGGMVYQLRSDAYSYQSLVELARCAAVEERASGIAVGFSVWRSAHVSGPRTAGMLKPQEIEGILAALKEEMIEALFPSGRPS